MGKRVNMEIKKTSLINFTKLQAKFVEFAGYQMPINIQKVLLKNINLQDHILEFLMFLIWVNYLFMEMIFN